MADRKHEAGCGAGSGIEPCICGVDDVERDDVLEEAARMLEDMARDWDLTADDHSKAAGRGFSTAADAARDARRVARTYEKAARKVREMKGG